MELFLIIIAIAVLTPMALGPFMIKSGHWISAHAGITAISAESLDPGARAFLEQSKEEFESLGFDFLGYMMLSDYIPNRAPCNPAFDFARVFNYN